MKKPETWKRRLTKTTTVNISLPQNMADWVDEVAESSEVSRSEVFQWILLALMEDKEISSKVFGWEEDEDEDEDEDEEEE